MRLSIKGRVSNRRQAVNFIKEQFIRFNSHNISLLFYSKVIGLFKDKKIVNDRALKSVSLHKVSSLRCRDNADEYIHRNVTDNKSKLTSSSTLTRYTLKRQSSLKNNTHLYGDVFDRDIWRNQSILRRNRSLLFDSHRQIKARLANNQNLSDESFKTKINNNEYIKPSVADKLAGCIKLREIPPKHQLNCAFARISHKNENINELQSLHNLNPQCRNYPAISKWTPSGSLFSSLPLKKHFNSTYNCHNYCDFLNESETNKTKGVSLRRYHSTITSSPLASTISLPSFKVQLRQPPSGYVTTRQNKCSGKYYNNRFKKQLNNEDSIRIKYLRLNKSPCSKSGNAKSLCDITTISTDKESSSPLNRKKSYLINEKISDNPPFVCKRQTPSGSLSRSLSPQLSTPGSPSISPTSIISSSPSPSPSSLLSLPLRSAEANVSSETTHLRNLSQNINKESHPSDINAELESISDETIFSECSEDKVSSNSSHRSVVGRKYNPFNMTIKNRKSSQFILDSSQSSFVINTFDDDNNRGIYEKNNDLNICSTKDDNFSLCSQSKTKHCFFTESATAIHTHRNYRNNYSLLLNNNFKDRRFHKQYSTMPNLRFNYKRNKVDNNATTPYEQNQHRIEYIKRTGSLHRISLPHESIARNSMSNFHRVLSNSLYNKNHMLTENTTNVAKKGKLWLSRNVKDNSHYYPRYNSVRFCHSPALTGAFVNSTNGSVTYNNNDNRWATNKDDYLNLNSDRRSLLNCVPIRLLNTRSKPVVVGEGNYVGETYSREGNSSKITIYRCPSNTFDIKMHNYDNANVHEMNGMSPTNCRNYCENNINQRRRPTMMTKYYSLQPKENIDNVNKELSQKSSFTDYCVHSAGQINNVSNSKNIINNNYLTNCNDNGSTAADNDISNIKIIDDKHSIDIKSPAKKENLAVPSPADLFSTHFTAATADITDKDTDKPCNSNNISVSDKIKNEINTRQYNKQHLSYNPFDQRLPMPIKPLSQTLPANHTTKLIRKSTNNKSGNNTGCNYNHQQHRQQLSLTNNTYLFTMQQVKRNRSKMNKSNAMADTFSSPTITTPTKRADRNQTAATGSTSINRVQPNKNRGYVNHQSLARKPNNVHQHTFGHELPKSFERNQTNYPLGLRLSVAGASKSLKGSSIPMHNRNLNKGDFGDDAGMVFENQRFCFIALADGAGGNRNKGIDPSIFSKNLVWSCYKILQNGSYSTKQLLQLVTASMRKIETRNILGSATFCLLGLDRYAHILHTLNIGDSGVKIVRNYQVIFSTRKTMNGSSPCQLFLIDHTDLFKMGINPTSFIRESEIMADSSFQSVRVRHGDILVMSSDGLWDVIDDRQLIEVIKSNESMGMQRISDVLLKTAFKAYVGPFRDDILIMISAVTWI
ncbi:hypothetical protein GJ496_008669 [Pomphorhynchus laevis]|nr:hypothetical protein GJ496_008669 [Pomphorhynchus laevis]